MRKIIRSGIPIKQKGSSYAFNHKSIQEFLVAKDVYDKVIRYQERVDSEMQELIIEHVLKQNITLQKE
jgi:hypothetical protein